MTGIPEPRLESDTPIKIDVWSDVQCGWCYIAKRRLEAAAEKFEGEIEIEYHSYELAPDAPVEFNGSTKEFLHHYRGVPFAESERMLAQVASIAAGVGLDYHYDRTQPTNTILAHELIHFAKSKGRQGEMNERLSAAYFELGEHIGRIFDLVEIAVELGFYRDEVTDTLTEHRFLPQVEADFARARELGVQGVPFFVFDNKYGMSGAQETNAFLQALQHVHDERKPNADYEAATR